MKTKNLAILLAALASPLALFASSKTDRQIESAAVASYNYRTVLEDHVTVIADDGVVTLTGTVQDTEEKDLAADTVANLPGVTKVNNDITIRSKYPLHSDAWIVLKIRARLLTKANVSLATTTVTAQDGVVVLGGTARNPAQKELTGIYASEIEGVTSVKNDLVLDATPAERETVGEELDDASITSQVKYALLSHRATSAVKTKVTTTNGVVALSGDVGSEEEKALVTKLAEAVRGVKSVGNRMTVKI